MIGRLLCWFGKHLPGPNNRGRHGIWICTRRGCNQLCTGKFR